MDQGRCVADKAFSGTGRQVDDQRVAGGDQERGTNRLALTRARIVSKAGDYFNERVCRASPVLSNRLVRERVCKNALVSDIQPRGMPSLGAEEIGVVPHA